MKLSSEQQAEIKATHGVCANEACDTCKRLLDHIRYIRKDQPGEWCSRVCRDGAEAAERHAATRKKPTGRCWHCGLPIHGEARTDTKYCDSTCARNARRAKAASRAIPIAA